MDTDRPAVGSFVGLLAEPPPSQVLMGFPYKGVALAQSGLFPAVAPASSVRPCAVTAPLRVALGPLRRLVLPVKLQRSTLICVDGVAVSPPVPLYVPPLPSACAVVLCLIFLTLPGTRRLLLSAAPHSPAAVVPVEDDITAACATEVRRVVSRPALEGARVTLLCLTTGRPSSRVTAVAWHTCSRNNAVDLLLKT